MTNFKKVSQSGFSLIELLVVVVIIGIVGSTILSNMSTDKTKVTVMLDNMNTFRTGLARFNNDAGCYPVKIQALFDKTKATGTATDTGFCTSDVSAAIPEAYIDATEYNSTTNAIKMPKVGANVEVSTGYDSTNKIWYMKGAGLATNLLDLAVTSCNGQDVSATPPTAWTAGVKCIKSGTDILFAFQRK